MTPVLFEFKTPDGAPLAGAQVEIQLATSSYDVLENGIVLPRQVLATTDSTGKVTVSLASVAALYYVTVLDPASEAGLSYKFYTPSVEAGETVRLQDLVVDAAMSGEPYDVTALRVIQDSKAMTLTYRNEAQVAATTATTKAAEASASAASTATDRAAVTDLATQFGDVAATLGSAIAPISVVNYAGLRAYTGPAASVDVTGYLVNAAPGRNAGSFTRDDADTTTPDNGGTVIVAANGVRWKRQIDGATNILWFIPEEEHAAILDETSTYDCTPAIHAAIHAAFAGATHTTLTGIDDDGNPVTRAPAANWYFSSGEVFFPPGRYRCASTIVIDRQCKLVGTSSGLPQGAGSKLSFPMGVGGIIVNNFDTDGLSTDPVPNGGAYPTPVSANACVIEGLSLFADTFNHFRDEPSTSGDLIAYPHGHNVFLVNGPPGGGFYEDGSQGDPEAHGIRIRGMCLIRNCFIFGFEGSGIYLNCSFSIPTGLAHGNGNLFRLEGVSSYRNAQHGVFIEGADSNAGSGYNINVVQNGKCGIYDSSFLGNTWIACHANTNAAEQYKTDNINACSVFIGCYSEVGGLPSSFATGTIVIGGLHGAGMNGDARFIQASGGGNGVRLYPNAEAGFLSLGLQSAGDSTTPRTTGYALRFSDTTETNGSTSYWQLKRELGRLLLLKAETGGVLSFFDSGCTVANGYARNYTDGPMSNVGQMMIGTHFFGTKTEMKYRGLASAVPATGEYLRGDIIWSSVPAAAGKMGWVCTTGGTAGSTAVFKQFGAIDA